jgi:lipooligosaccharide transport system ATP-binding protein
MIVARQLEKSFGEFRAVDQMSLEIRKGECFGLLGPNGAGKSTFISLVYGAALRTGGDLEVFGHDPAHHSREIKKRLGVVTQDNALDESLTVMENMLLYCAFVGIPKSERRSRIEELLEYMNLSHKKEASIQSLSGGMKRRLVFVRALLGQPELLILDEPTTGLDPAVRHLLWGKVRELHQSGTTIVLTTHYMHEAEVLCDRLVILNGGKVVAEGSPRAMIEEHAPGYVGIFALEDRDRIFQLSANDKDLESHEDASGLYLRTPDLEQLTAFHSVHKIRPLQIRPSNLEDVFLKLTGQGLSEDA